MPQTNGADRATMNDMIRRLTHPVRGVIAGVLAWFALAKILGFGVGVPEMLLITVVAIAACVAVGGIGRLDESLAGHGKT